MKQRQKETGIAHLGLIIAAIVVVAAVAFGGWYVWDKNKDDKNSSNKNNSSQSNNTQNSQNGEPSDPSNKVFDCKGIFSVTYPASLEATSTTAPECLIANVSTDDMPPVGPLPPEQLGLSFGASPTEISTSKDYLADYIDRSQQDAALELRSQEEIKLDNGGTATLAKVYGGHPVPHEFYFFVYLKEGRAITTFYPTNSNYKDLALKILKSIR